MRAQLFAVTGDVPGNMSLSITIDAYLRMGEGESVCSSAIGCYVKIHTFPINHREVQAVPKVPWRSLISPSALEGCLGRPPRIGIAVAMTDLLKNNHPLLVENERGRICGFVRRIPTQVITYLPQKIVTKKF